MNYQIRPIRKEEIPILGDFLYEAIFIPEGVAAPHLPGVFSMMRTCRSISVTLVRCPMIVAW